MKKYRVNTADICHNVKIIQQKCGQIIGVIKANGYGIGLENMATILSRAGIEQFAVTEVSDLHRLRAAGFRQPVLVLRSTCLAEEAAQILAADGIATIGSEKSAQAYDVAAAQAGVRAKAHVKLDTGMSRYGFLPEDTATVVQVVQKLKNVDICGVYTHFSNAFGDAAGSAAQLERFTAAVARLQAAGISTGVVHAANSAGIFNVAGACLDAVRPGSALLGRAAVSADCGFKRVGMLHSRVIELKTIRKGAGVGYLSAYRAKSERTLAIVPVGNADGFGVGSLSDVNDFPALLRGLRMALRRFIKKEGLYVTIGGKRYPTVGHIGLNHTAVDVTGAQVAVGDEVQVDVNPLFVNPLIARVLE